MKSKIDISKQEWGRNIEIFVSLNGKGAFKAAKSGSIYAEFDVPSQNILTGSGGLGIVPGKNPSNYLKLRLAKQGGNYPSTFENLSEILDTK